MPRLVPFGRIAENLIPSGGLPDGRSHRAAGIPLAVSDTMTPSDLLPQPQFLRALRVERKRAERSRRPFILMLVAPDNAAQNGVGASLLRKAAAALVPAVRETDIAG